VSSAATVTTFNLHAGIDAWGRPFDVVDAVCSIGADVMLLQECWTPDNGESDAALIARELNGFSRTVELAAGRRGTPDPNATETWERPRPYFEKDHGLYLDSKRPLPAPLATSARAVEGDPGSWGVAIVSRTPLDDITTVTLPDLRRDQVGRAVLFATTTIEGTRWRLACVHMSHLLFGSPLHFTQLRRLLVEHRTAAEPFVLGGDMNAWGPLVSGQLPGLRRAVTGRTWPAWRPHSQLDHLLVNDAVTVVGGHVIDDRSSDHRPVVAQLAERAR
jgi:endonuclease/exonuclease/phosphatase family metal-dependent hydrolase